MGVALTQGGILQGRYLIGSPLGHGSVGTTYACVDQALQTDVALKVVISSHEVLLSALKNEFVFLSQSRHPHLLHVHDFGATTVDGHEVFFYTSDLLNGTDLLGFAEGNKSFAEVTKPLCDAVEALGFLHRCGLRHGDIKPDNILVSPSAEGTLIDLSCARHVDTFDDELSGTPGFLAPELLRGGERPSGVLTDLFALGVTLDAVARQTASVPKAVSKLIRALRSPQPQERPTSVEQVLEVLGRRKLFCSPQAVLTELQGRSGEMATFEGLLDLLVQGAAGQRVLWMRGAAGVGKSRLLREMLIRAQLRSDCVVAQGFARESQPLWAALQRAQLSAGAPAMQSQKGLPGLLDQVDAWRKSRAKAVVFFDDIHHFGESQRRYIQALTELLRPEDALMVVVTAPYGPPAQSAARAALELGPLSLGEVEAWARGQVPPPHATQLFALTEGLPGDVERLLAKVASGQIRPDRLRNAGAAPLGDEDQKTLHSLGEHEQVLIALLALFGAVFPFWEVELRRGQARAVDRLVARGLVLSEPGGIRLTRPLRSAATLGALSPSAARAASDLLVGYFAKQASQQGEVALREDFAARAAEVLALGGQAKKALRELRKPAGKGQAYQRWARAADAVAEALGTPQSALARAAMHCEAGNPDVALKIAGSLLLQGIEDRHAQVELRLITARCYLRLGDAQRCTRQLQRATPLLSDPCQEAEHADLQARAALQRGQATEAEEVARAALVDQCPEGAIKARLHEDLGVAASFLGHGEEAHDHFLAAQSAQRAEDQSPRDQIRLLSYTAINQYRRGKTDEAARAYRQALDLAESFLLSDQSATAALNLGTALHQLGHWAQALSRYEYALRLATGLRSQSTTVLIQINLAQLYVELGAIDRAEAAVGTMAEQARRHGWVEGAAHSLRAQVASIQRNRAASEKSLSQALEIFGQLKSQRELSELHLQKAELALDFSDVPTAAEALVAAKEGAATQGAPDLDARMEMVEGRLLFRRGSPAEGLERIERALESYALAGQLGSQAEAAALLAEGFEQSGAPALARRHRQRATELWERVGTALPEPLRRAFWTHPKRRALRAVGSPQGEEHTQTNLGKVLDIYSQLSASLDVDRVLELTLDAAIELFGAQRGFLILREETGLRIPLARNMDKERIGSSELQLSRSIALEVLDTGRPVVTVDAAQDSRFKTNASVHAMKLRSVISVPIRAGATVKGALYLDNRFERSRFTEDQMWLLSAFADQAAIALHNAELVQALEQRQKDLEAEREKVAELLADREQEIEKLSTDLKLRQHSLELRYDYSHIIGKSLVLRRALQTLDRVIDTNLPVLIQGESGTGKELVAKAIHFNGPRKKGPFVTVNCAALTETLLESELFGHVKGAFTGAVRDRAGLFVEAKGGTLFLDEIGDMPPGMQAKLLRVLQDNIVRPVGSEKVTHVDVRILSATHRDLKDEVEQRRFREDLFYRIVVVHVVLPPLRDRIDDIAPLADHFLDALARENGKHKPTLTAAALRKLGRHPFKGNVRELKNIMARAFVLSKETIRPADLEIVQGTRARGQALSRRQHEKKEAETIMAALEASNWNVSTVSRELKIPRTTLYRKLRKYGLIDRR